MSISMYHPSVRIFERQLGNLSHVLAKGAAHAEATGMDPAELLEARLAPDMHPLTRQVQIASDSAKGCVGRLGGMPIPSFADEEKSFPELQERIGKTVAFISTVPAEQIAESDERQIVLKVGQRELNFVGREYLLHFVLPNFFFHLTMTYAILRHKGVALGKMDFLGAVS